MQFHPFLLFVPLFLPLFHLSTADQSQPAISQNSNITLLGSASLLNKTLSLTNPNHNSSTGQALHSNLIRFIDPLTRQPASFSTRFTFTIIPSPSFGDGFTFFITSNPQFLSSLSGSFGLFGPGENCTDQTVTIAVEFDTHFDAELRDLDDNHVALDLCSVYSSVSASVTNSGLDLKQGRAITAWIEYESSENELTVWLSYPASNRPVRPILVAAVNLSELVQEFIYVGFSASNGAGTALHLIENWTFRTSFSSDSNTNDFFSPRIDSSTDFQPNVQTETSKDLLTPHRKRKRRLIGPILGILSSLFLLFTLVTIIYFRRNPSQISLFPPRFITREEQRHTEDETERQIERELGQIPGRISMREIRIATRGFNRRNILGRGSSATVYEGRLQSGSKIAVKRFSQTGQTGHFTRTFASELGATIASCRHRNLVPLTGWCRYGTELILVYEFMPNGTLHDALHSSTKPPLSWQLRYDILKGVATGLEFLHNRCERRILHRDVKACNVMLDEGFNARLGDLGFAHLSSHGREPAPTQVVGTPGYMAPEYVLTGVATEQVDVYSFGVLTLQVATGRPPVQNSVSLVDSVWDMRTRRRMLDAADPRLNGGFDRAELVRVLLVGLACAYPDSEVRPSMRRVVRMLEGNSPPPSLPLRRSEREGRVTEAGGEAEREGSDTSYHSCE